MADRFDEEVKAAVKARILRELQREEKQAQIVNNLYGSGNLPASSGGLQDRFSPDEDPFEYLVDITRENTPKGWKKTVHRHRKLKEYMKRKNEAVDDELK